MSNRTVKGSRTNELLRDLEDYVAELHKGDDLVGDNDIERISSILGQSNNSNLIYVGKSGLGKTAAIYGIARRKKSTIEGALKEGERRLPLHMIDRQFHLLDVNTLFEDNDEERIQSDIKRILAEVSKPGNHVLIIEDANDLLRGIEDNQCQGFISAFIRELKKKTFQSILMVRDEPGKNNLGKVMECHSEMAELFTILEKKPPSKDDVLEIMRSSKAGLEKHHDGLHITDEANEEIVKLTFLYPNLRIYMREQPSRSLRMRDQIASTFVSRMQSRPRELDELEKSLHAVEKDIADKGTSDDLERKKLSIKDQIAAINQVWEERASALGAAYLDKRKHENEYAELENEHEKLMTSLGDKIRSEKNREPTESDFNTMKTQDIKDAEKFMRESRKDIEAASETAKSLKGEHNNKLTLTPADVREYFSELSGIPAKDLNANEATKALDLDKRLKDKIYGQDDAVDTISSAIKRAKAGLKDPQKPIGSFMLLGSSGVGKTYSAECLAEDLYDDKESMTVFDMSEFMEKHTVSRLIGAPPGYAGYGEGGALTNAVRIRPYQVILFDEIEKAHPDVFKILLQVLDKGRLSDELGTVDFRNTVILMTTNLGQHLSFDKWRTAANSSDDIKAEVRTIFPQELINRVDDFLLFRALEPVSIENVIKRDISALNKRMNDKGITVEMPPSDVSALVKDKYKVEEGARQVQNFLKREMTGQIADIVLRRSQDQAGGTIVAHYDPEQNGFKLDFTTGIATPEPAKLIVPPPLMGGTTGGMAAVAAAHAQPTLRAAFTPCFH